MKSSLCCVCNIQDKTPDYRRRIKKLNPQDKMFIDKQVQQLLADKTFYVAGTTYGWSYLVRARYLPDILKPSGWMDGLVSA